MKINIQANNPEPIAHFTPKEVAKAIDELKVKKAPGIDGISAKILKELPKKAVILLVYIYNGILRLKHVPEQWKIAKIILIHKTGKPRGELSSYRPISLLPIPMKIFEKLFLIRLKRIVDKNLVIPDHQYGFRSYHSTIDQVHRVTQTIERALEEKKFCTAVFLDVEKAFDRVWHEGLLHKISGLLPGNFCEILKSYLYNRSFKVQYNEAVSNQHVMKAGVPQGSTLGPLLYLLYSADIPENAATELVTFADDTAILSVNDSYDQAVTNLQTATDQVCEWAQSSKIKLNEEKSIRVDFSLRPCNYIPTAVNDKFIPRSDSARYLGMHLDRRLNWKVHVKKKRDELNLKLRNLYWLLGHRSSLSLANKRLIYMSILKPVWTYGLQIWGTAKQSNRLVIQRVQNKALRLIAKAQWFVPNSVLHRDLQIQSVDEVIGLLAAKHEDRLHVHPNVTAIQLLDTSRDIRRLKRLKPHDLVI